MSSKITKNSRDQNIESRMFDFKLVTFMFSLWMNLIDPFHILRGSILRPMLNIANGIYEKYKAKVFYTLDSSQSAALRVSVISMIGFLLFCTSILMYTLFYLVYMPTSIQIKPVHLQYNRLCESGKCDMEAEVSPFHSYPLAHISLNRAQQMMVDVPYFISVRFDVPETERNRDLGIFMVCIDMKDKEGILKSQSCRSSMLRYYSEFLRKLKMVAFLPFYIFGFREERQELDVEMYSRYVDTKNSVTDIYIEIQSKVLEFYSVSLVITAHFTGLRYIIHHFPTTSAIIGIAFNFFALIIATLFLWYRYDFEMDWIDQPKSKISKDTEATKSNASIPTTDENISVLDTFDHHDKLEDDDFIFGMPEVKQQSDVRPRFGRSISEE